MLKGFPLSLEKYFKSNNNPTQKNYEMQPQKYILSCTIDV